MGKPGRSNNKVIFSCDFTRIRKESGKCLHGFNRLPRSTRQKLEIETERNESSYSVLASTDDTTRRHRRESVSSRRSARVHQRYERRCARRPVSRVLYAPRGCVTIIPLGRALLRASRDQPGRRGERPPDSALGSAVPPPLFGLAPGGVCPAAAVAGSAVRSCRTVSPLPAGALISQGWRAGGLFSVALSLGSPPPAVSRHRPFVEPGLSSITPRVGDSDRPAVWRAEPAVQARPRQAAPIVRPRQDITSR